jgi:hypothetical protein
MFGHRLLFTRQEIQNIHGFAIIKIKHLGADASMSKAERMLWSKVYPLPASGCKHLPASYHVRTMFGLSSDVLRMFFGCIRTNSEGDPKRVRRTSEEI